ncbi:hypothetical protein NQ318_020799 [Aromia moschata]|uniref:DUF5641 domain-containing protein n=1 Tax=Aromia moschata TaxID=1265417 RepID=A0AAV8YC00_9CUCU|nr:hypothetical protein NQ318_020799 [Aromia moschata]
MLHSAGFNLHKWCSNNKRFDELFSENNSQNKFDIKIENVSNKVLELQIHGFADATLQAYGSCIYLRALYSDNTVSCNLVCAKSRVAPLRTISLPRLELCGVVLLSRLTNKIMSALSEKIHSVNLWTDSQITLCWLKSHPSRNRVSEVQELTSKFQWRHVRSANNPSDLLSRGLGPSELKNNSLWWHGPQFLFDFSFQLETQNLFLNPWIDEKGIIRINGRLSNAQISFDQKYPILLPAKNHVVTLLFRKEHLRLFHAGAQSVLSNIRLSRLSFWQRCMKLQQDFCNKWSTEYLNRLQNRPKWFRSCENLKVNDLVLLKEDNVAPLNWPRARIIEVLPGLDKKVRVVRLKTSEGEIVRSIAKICPLPQNC